jgi:hypothetical protein|tara:strand:- start:632 stop:1759 length:1128 start_codon:yes stop_codon:yes gene_type:complete
MVLLVSLSGCTGLSSTTPNAEITSDTNEINMGEVVNFDGRESSTPSPSIITDYTWNFGDGEIRMTKAGIISHHFQNSGNFEIELTVTNDLGESDSVSISVFVNSPPTIIIEIPGYVKTGEVAILDASSSFDPEGGSIEYIWDLDKTVDSDGDGNPSGDADENNAVIEVKFTEPGNHTGILTIVDDKGGISYQEWTLMVISRNYRITWEEKSIDFSWSGYLEQGETVSFDHEPGLGARILHMNATLTLARDLIPIMWPEDNFSLYLDLPMTGWSTFTSTTHDNITENATAYIDIENMNDIPNSGYTIQSDSSETIVNDLLDESGQRFGQGDWIWTISADQCDPDLPVDGIDPDTGNDWDLQIEFVILIPRVSEIGV